jgi:hypothetical protein
LTGQVTFYLRYAAPLYHRPLFGRPAKKKTDEDQQERPEKGPVKRGPREKGVKTAAQFLGLYQGYPKENDDKTRDKTDNDAFDYYR